MQRCSNHAPTTIELLLETVQPLARQLQQLDYNNGNGVFSMYFVPRSYRKYNWDDADSGQLKVSL
jgi:hypothetical protein